MRKSVFLLLLFVAIQVSVNAQGLVSRTSMLVGTVVEDAQYNDKLSGATVVLEDTYYSIATDAKGTFKIKRIPSEVYVVRVSLIGYETLRVKVDLEKSDSLNLTFKLKPSTLVQDEVTVTANRISDNASTSISRIDKKEIEKLNYGQDLTYALNNTPGVVVTSFNGNGIGYTGLSIRGTDNTRTNIMINGIPLNDAESQGAFTINLPDLLASTDNIQVQRGVGTSTNGAGAFGASVNIQTTKLNTKPYAEINNVYSLAKGEDINIKINKGGKKVLDQGFAGFGTAKNSISLGTGLLNDHFAFDGRFSQVSTDGYVDRGAVDLSSYLVSGGYYSEKLLVKANHFSGKERTYLTFTGVPQSKLNGDSTLINHYYNNLGYLYFTPADSVNLFDTSNTRTYNNSLYKGETDNYKQDHYQLLTNYQLNKNLNVSVNLHYTKGKGYFEQFKYNQAFAKHNLDTLFIGGDTIASTDLVKQRWLDNDFYGFTYNVNYYSKQNFSLIAGGGYNTYIGNHYGDVVWARFASQSTPPHRYYEAEAKKSDFNIYFKPTLKIAKRFEAFVDMQIRTVNYKGSGDDNNRKNVDFSDAFIFFNPKIGGSFTVDARNKFFAFFGQANKEPNRDDYRNLAPLREPNAEKLTNTEIGYSRKGNIYALNLTAYNMSYADQLILTGALNDVGEALRVNVAESYRRGIEIDGSVKPVPFVKLSANFAYSINKVLNYEEKLNKYDPAGAPDGFDSTTYALSTIALSPSMVGSGLLEVEPIRGLNIGLFNKYVGKQYLDNTQTESRILKAYYAADLRLAYTLVLPLVKELTFSVALNNVFNTLYENGGYSYGYMYDGTEVRESFYYPQAVRNVLFGLNAKF